MRPKPTAFSLYLLIPITVLVSVLAHAEPIGTGDQQAIFEEAAEALNGEYLKAWAFTETAVNSDATTVGRYDPNYPEDQGWTLLSINGHAPTETEVAEYLEVKTNGQGNSAEDSNADEEEAGGDEGVSAMVEPASLALVEETDEYWLFSFAPSADEDGDAFAEAVIGTVKIVKNGHYVASVGMHNTRPFKPQFGVKIKQFTTRLQFGPAVEEGPIVPLSVDFKVDARAFLVKTVKEATSITFSDYQYVGDL